jgi:hypothetical protein
MNYDPKIMIEFATARYKEAESVVFWYSTVGIFLGLLLGAPFAIIGQNLGGEQTVSLTIFAMLLPVIGGVLGFALSRERAFQLRLEAQRTLCAVQIEQNIRALVPQQGYAPAQLYVAAPAQAYVPPPPGHGYPPPQGYGGGGAPGR